MLCAKYNLQSERTFETPRILVNKSTKILNFISRDFYHCTHETKAKLNLTLVRPTLEYACCMGPYTQRNISSLEKVQRRAARFVFRDYSCESSVSYMLSALDRPFLSERGECQLLNSITLHRCLN